MNSRRLMDCIIRSFQRRIPRKETDNITPRPRCPRPDFILLHLLAGAIGPLETLRDVHDPLAIGGIPDSLCSQGVLSVLTHMQH